MGTCCLNKFFCHGCVEELEPNIRYCLHKIGESNLQTSGLINIAETEGLAADIFNANLEASLIIYEEYAMLYCIYEITFSFFQLCCVD